MAEVLYGIYNENEFYSHHYLGEVLASDLKEVMKEWHRQEEEDPDNTPPYKQINRLRKEYFKTKAQLSGSINDQAAIGNSFIQQVLSVLGYSGHPEVILPDRSENNDVLPLSARIADADGKPQLWLFEAYCHEGESLLDSLFIKDQFPPCSEMEPDDHPCTEMTLEEIMTAYVFTMEQPPRWVLLVGFYEIILLDRSKWVEKRYLRFDMDELFNMKDLWSIQVFCALLSKDRLVPLEGESLPDTLNENSHKHAFSVSEDLKYSLREAVELLGNEAVRQRGVKELAGKEDQLTRECLRYMYRLLFLFYIESRPELGYASMNNEIYLKGYSLEHLRDLVEAPPPQTEEERNGRFFHNSLTLLFRLIEKGHTPAGANPHITNTVVHNNFYMEPLFNHLFDSKMTPVLNKIAFPNHILFRVIELMSLSRPRKGKRSRRGRISYVQLGINQLGAVYEGLLSYRGFIAHEDLYEVQRAEDAGKYDELSQAMFVTENELSKYDKKKEIVINGDGSFKVYPKGSFIYRLAGRDRQKSASYYTPEVLTHTLVKYALKELIKDKSAAEILDIHVCEPAMGSAAFLNEAINQLANLYLRKKQEELGQRIPHETYRTEKQKVKMLLADRNVFGVDLNPIAVELGEVSLWLNTIVPGGFVPWFGLQLRCGNSLAGARRAVFSTDQLEKAGKATWLASVPRRLPLHLEKFDGRKNEIFHFLLPDTGMAHYTDKVVKKHEEERIKAINTWRNTVTIPFEEDDIQALKVLSISCEQLWQTWAEHLGNSRSRTTDPLDAWGYKDADHTQTDLRLKDTIYMEEIESYQVLLKMKGQIIIARNKIIV